MSLSIIWLLITKKSNKKYVGAFSDLCALETQKQVQNHVLSKCKSFPDSVLESATGPRCVIETHRASSLVE